MAVDLSNVAPELRPALRRLPPLAFANGLVRALIRTMLGFTPATKVEGVSLTTRRDIGAGVRIHTPDVRKSRGALLWLHGGGYVIGRPIQDDRLCAETAAELGIIVVAAGYRLAPEHPFPAPLADAFAAWSWMQRSAPELEINPRRIAIGGESAGGGLAAGLVQRVSDTEPNPAAAQWLFCPMLDDRTAARRDFDEPRNHVWSNRTNAYGWSAHLGTAPGALELPPYASPARRHRLDGLPPAWIGVGEIDLFLAEDRAYAERLQAAGVETRFVTVPGAPHGFEAWAPQSSLARAFVADARGWLASALADA